MSPTTELLICTTCREPDAPREGPTAGQALFDRLQAGLAADAPVRLRGIACLAACDRSCTMALQAAGKTTYVFGALTPDAACAEAVLTVALEHAQRADGTLVWAARPQRLRRGVVARLPALPAAPVTAAAADGHAASAAPAAPTAPTAPAAPGTPGATV
ncbi:MAG: hypothetical protein RL223_2750 [Pseudomonadota bacterium]|jgi:predicted metal-binding protein